MAYDYRTSQIRTLANSDQYALRIEARGDYADGEATETDWLPVDGDVVERIARIIEDADCES